MSKKKAVAEEAQSIDWGAIEALEKASHKAPEPEAVSSEPSLLTFEEWFMLREQITTKINRTPGIRTWFVYLSRIETYTYSHWFLNLHSWF